MTVTRMFTGKLYGSKRGEWSFGAAYLPLNATLTSPEKRIVSREELARLEERELSEEDVRALAEARLTVELAAEAWDRRTGKDPLTSTDFLRRLSDDPAARARIRHHVAKHQGASLTKLTTHDAAVRDRVRMVPVMLDGEYLQIQGLPLAGLTEDDLHGWPVYRLEQDNELEKGFTVLTWKMPTLEGIAPEVATKAMLYAEHINAQQREHGQGIIAEQCMLPLTSIWESTTAGRLQRRLVSTTGVGPGYQWKEAVRDDRASFHANSEVVGKFRLAPFNRKFVAAIEQLAAGDQVDLASVTMNVSPTPGRAAGRDDDGLEELRIQRTGVQATLDAYQVSARASSGAAAALADLISEAKSSLARLDRDIELQATQALAATEPGVVDEGFVGTLADLCAITEKADHPLPPAINRAWRELLVPGEVTCEAWSPWAEISFALAIPTDTGLHETRQVSFTVANKTRGFLRTGPDGSEQIRRDAYYRRIAPEAYRLRMVGQRDLGQLAGRMDIDTQTLSSNLVGLLKGTRGPYQGTPVYSAASKNLYRAGLDCAVPSTRAIVYTLLAQAGRLPWDLPGQTSAIPSAPDALPARVEGLDVAETLRWIDHLDDTHLALNATWSVASWSAGGEHDSRQVLAYVTAHTDPTVAGLMAAMGWKTRAAADRHLLGRRATGGRRQPLVIEIHPDDRSVGSGNVAYDQQRLRPIVCPWADCGWDRGLHVLPVPECPDAVICPACRRMPSDPTLVFPPSYLQQFEGPYGNHTAKSKNAAAAGGTRIVASPTQIPAAWRRTRDRQRPAA